MSDKITIKYRKKMLIIYVLLALATLAVFWQVYEFDFVNYDDPVYVTENIDVRSGITLEGLHWAFGSTHANNFWYPILCISFLLDYQLFGLNAGGYHMINLILHMLSTLLLFWLFHRMTGAVWKSAFVAAFFAVHPLHVESVAWITERKDVLSAFFWMLTLRLYIYYTEKPVIKRYTFIFLPFILALMSKPMVVTLPLIMILLDYWPLKRFESQKGNILLWQMKEKIPFVFLSVVLIIITLLAQSKTLNIFPLKSRLANAAVSFVTYLGKTFWPNDLAAFYPFPENIPSWHVFGSIILIIAVSAVVIVTAKRSQYLVVGWLWYTITILPVIGIIQSGDQAMADRFHYLPSIGIVIMMAWGLPALFRSKIFKKKILLPMEIIFLIIMALLAWKQCGYWKNDVTLFNHALRMTKNNYMAHTNLGASLFEKGKTREAFYHFDKAVIIKPDSFYTYINRGAAYFQLGQYQRAVENYTKAISIRGDYADGFYKRGSTYYLLGDFQKTIDDYNKAVFLKPDYAEVYNNRGTIYYNKFNQYQKSIEDYSKAISIKPDYADAYNNRALIYLNNGDSGSGCRDARKACDLENCSALINARAKGLCR